MAPRIVANILCHNDLIYLQNLIPLVQRFADRIIVVDDCSNDGSYDWLSRRINVQTIVRKFDLNFSNQRNTALELVDNGDWVVRIDSDEVPADSFVSNIRNILPQLESMRCDRLSIPIFHMVNLDMCKLQLGLELRMFKKNETCLYRKQFHEEIHGTFPKDTTQLNLPEHYAMIHWKYADPKKVEYTKTFFVNNGLYDPDDLKTRLEMESTFLPPYVKYTINDELKDYLCLRN